MNNRCSKDTELCGFGFGVGGRGEVGEGRGPAGGEMAASARQGERATSFAMACSLLSRLVRQNGAAAAELGLGIKGGSPSPKASRVEPLIFFFSLTLRVSGMITKFLFFVLIPATKKLRFFV